MNKKIDEEVLCKALDLLCEMTTQADQDTPIEYRTRHFRDAMSDCYDFLVEQGILKFN